MERKPVNNLANHTERNALDIESNKKKKYEIDMVNGPLFGKILLFYFPLMLSGVLQLLFNAADIVVVGRFAGNDSLAAVGSTSSLINLLVNLFFGLSVGTNVLAARYFGGKQNREIEELVHTAVATSVISGCILVVVGVLISAPALTMMGTPDNVLDKAVLYMRIYFAGMPFFMLYNFGSAILRAVGDTRRPLYFLLISGVLNVVLNLIFVIGFSWGVAGVAIATVISQALSSVLVLRCLMNSDATYKVYFKKLRIVPDKLFRMIQLGMPAGLQGALFSISNVLIQSSVNSFGSLAMGGNTAATNIEGFVYTSMNSFYQTAISFTGQNFGAKKYKRIGQTALLCEASVFVVGVVLGNLSSVFSGTLIQLYSTDPEVIRYGMLRLGIIGTSYFLCGMMDTMVGVLRGMGYSIMPMLVSLTGACLFRVIWIMTVFQKIRTLNCLYDSYPISWALTFAVHFICFLVVYKKRLKNEKE